MKSFFVEGVIIFSCVFVALCLIVTMAVGLKLAEAHWDCHSYSAKTGIETQVIAGSCFVKDGEKWEVYSAYINQYHVDSK